MAARSLRPLGQAARVDPSFTHPRPRWHMDAVRVRHPDRRVGYTPLRGERTPAIHPRRRLGRGRRRRWCGGLLGGAACSRLRRCVRRRSIRVSRPWVVSPDHVRSNKPPALDPLGRGHGGRTGALPRRSAGDRRRLEVLAKAGLLDESSRRRAYWEAHQVGESLLDHVLMSLLDEVSQFMRLWSVSGVVFVLGLVGGRPARQVGGAGEGEPA